MTKFIGNCSNIIDWDEIVENLNTQQPAHSQVTYNRTESVLGIQSLYEVWDKAGYRIANDGGISTWEIFNPGTNFDPKIVDLFVKWAGLEKFTAAWISCIKPGEVSPWHWDVTDDLPTLNKSNFIRLHCHMQDPEPGHCIFLEDECLWQYKKGDVFQWKNRDIWHGGANCGLTPMYTFNFWL